PQPRRFGRLRQLRFDRRCLQRLHTGLGKSFARPAFYPFHCAHEISTDHVAPPQIGPAAKAGKSLEIRRIAAGARLVLRASLRYRAAQIRPEKIDAEAPARRRICHETRNSSGLSYDYGRDDRWHRIPDALDLGQEGRQTEPRYRLQVAPGLDRGRPATARPRRPRVALSEEVFGLSQKGLKPYRRLRTDV